jgi:hypothetical protein
VELYPHSPNTHSWRGAQLGGAQGHLYLYLYLLTINLMEKVLDVNSTLRSHFLKGA